MVVKSAFVHGYGVVDDARQASMAQSDWQDIRSRLNRLTSDTTAHCLGCNELVFLRAATSSKTRPHFCHFKGQGLTCPWGPDVTNTPDAIRAGIFDGNQESELHRYMCELVVELIKADERYVEGSGAVNKFKRSKVGRAGRWPDASFELEELGKFAVEVQLAPSLAPEVVGRSEFYSREGINLIWLLPWYSFAQVERAFAADIAQEARGNYFVLDEEAEHASRRQRTLMLRVAWRAEGGKLSHKLISLDDLTYREGSHPFFSDQVTQRIFQSAETRRQTLSHDLMKTKGYPHPMPKVILDQDEQPDHQGGRLIRVAVSIWTAAKGEFFNHLNDHSKLTGLIDAYLYSADGRRRGRVVEHMLKTTQAGLHVNASVWRKIAGLEPAEQLNEMDHWVAYVYSLFPEVFREDLRREAGAAGSLPVWAAAGSAS